MPDLSQNRTLRMLSAAHTGNYAVPALCCYNLESMLAVSRAASSQRSPAMILLFPWALHYASDTLVLAAAHIVRTSAVPLSLHLDHAQTPELVRRAADIPEGFDSIMCDMSHYERAENLRLTKELAGYCHERGIAVEAEPGRIEGGEDGVAETADLEGLLTTREDAREFVGCGIEMLAPAFGNVHGEYGPRGIRLEYERLEGIREEVGEGIRLVLHGADPFDEGIFEKCIKAGVTKVNINKGMNNAYEPIKRKGGTLTGTIEEGTTAMQEKIEEYMKMLGSSGKA